MAENKKLKCALYYRVSTGDQKEKHTIERQKSELPVFAEKMGWEIVGEYTDEGISGSFVEGREDFIRLLGDAEKEKFNILVVSEFSRISRSADPVERAIIVKTLQDNSIRIASPNDGLQSVETLDDELMVYLKQWQAAKEAKILVERLKGGKREKLRQNQHCHPSIVYGLERKKIVEGNIVKHIVEYDPEEKAVLDKIYKWVVNDGKSLTNCCVELNDRKIRTRKGKTWTVSTMSAILRKGEALTGQVILNRRRYKSSGNPNGKLKFDRLPDRPEEDWIRVKVPPLFTKPEYKRLKAKIESNRVEAIVKEDKFLLRGMVRCGFCGRVCACITSGSPGYKKSRYYVCNGRLLKAKLVEDKCEGPYVNALNLESAVMNNLISGLLKSPKKFLKQWSQVGYKKTEIKRVKEKIERKEQEILDKINQRKDLVNLYLAKHLPQEDIDEKAEQINYDIEELEKDKAKYEAELKEHERLHANVVLVQESLATFKSFGNTLIKKIEALPFEDKRNLISHFLQGDGYVQISKDFDKWARPEYGYKEVKNLPKVRDNLKTRGLLYPWWEFKGKLDIDHIINVLKDFNDQGKVPPHFKEFVNSDNRKHPERMCQSA